MKVVKLLLFVDQSIRDPKDSISKLLELVNSFSRVAGYKSQHTKISRFSTYDQQTCYERNKEN